MSAAASSPPAGSVRTCNNYFDGLMVTGRHKLIFFIIMLAYFLEQMDNWNFGFIAPAIFNSWGLDKTESNRIMGQILFWYFIGMTSGGFLGGVISDFIGRKKTFLLSMLLFSVGSVVNGLPFNHETHLWLFIAARALTGFGVFCLMVCSHAYIAEMAPAESRGKWQGLVAGVGFCAVPAIAFLCRLIIPLSPDAWRWIFYFGGIGILGLALAFLFLRESPRWLVAQNRRKEAEAVIREISGHDIELSETAVCVEPRSSVAEVLYGMFTRRYIVRTLVILFMFVIYTPAAFTFSSWTGKLLANIPVLDAAGAQMLDAAGKAVMLYDQKAMLTIMTIMSCGVPAGCFLSSFISDKGGRKIPLMVMFFLTALLSYLFGQFTHNFYLTAALGFLCNAVSLSGGFISFSYTPENYPTKMRNTATGFHNGMARLSVSGFQLVIPVILATFGGIVGGINYDVPAIYTTCAILYLLPIPIVALWGPRTGGKSLEEIS